MADQRDVIQKVVEILNDGHKGFMDFAQHSKDPQVKAFFVRESQTRAEFAYELQNAAGLRSDEEGTSGGAIHRFWADVKVKLGGGITLCLRLRSRVKTLQTKPIKRLSLKTG
jgi:uncharacterized protein (TIGR02284 family)